MATLIPLATVSGGFRRMQVGDVIDVAYSWALTGGDVTSAAGSAVATIANGAVTLAKMANLATTRLIGRSTAGTGVPEAISIGTGLSLSAGVLSATGGGGGTWGSITGTLSSQTDLQSALDAKMDTAGGAFSAGINFGSVVASAVNDFSKHIQLHVTAGFGLTVTATGFNYVIGNTLPHKWYSGGTTNTMTLDNSGNLGVLGAITTAGVAVGYLGVPYANKTANYPFTTADRDKGAAKNTTTAITFTLPASPTAGDVYPFANIAASGNLTIATASGTIRLAATATTGNRTCAPWGLGSATCVVGGASPVWLVTGAGVT